MRKLATSIIALAVIGVAVTAYAVSTTGTERADCPGRIVCPQTGDLVCRDQCPTVNPDRADCPGRIECPLTGRLVCADRCPLGGSRVSTDTETERPACCRRGD